jgi:uncharacterized membrane protein YczE
MNTRTTAITRHGLLATAQRGLAPHASSPLRQVLLIIVASVSIAVACSLLVHAGLGLAPYDVLNSAVSARTGAGLGLSTLIVTSVFFAVAWMLGRPPSLVSLGFMLSVSVAIGLAVPAMDDIQSPVLRVLAVPTAVMLFAFGVAIVVHFTKTGGAFELLMAAGQDRGISPTLVRTVLEFGALTVGILFGGTFGFATLFVAGSLGFAMRFWLHHISRLSPNPERSTATSEQPTGLGQPA